MTMPQELIRPLIRDLVPYSSARDEFSGQARIFLDANESPYSRQGLGSTNRYPDSKQLKLREAIGARRGLKAAQVFAGNGSDEAIDLLIRIFCEPGRDSIIISPPTYGMYAVSAGIQNIGVLKVPLKSDFTLDLDGIGAAISSGTKIMFLCSPNNPTGGCLPREQILQVLEAFPGIVVLDEAYIDYCADKSFVPELKNYDNLVILQTFSKAWSLAGIRLGIALADPSVIEALQKIKPPYNINSLSADVAFKALSESDFLESNIATTVKEREWLKEQLLKLSFVKHVYPSDANFLLVKFDSVQNIFETLKKSGIVVRDRSKDTLCGDCLRITIGAPNENRELLRVLVGME